MRRLLAVLFSIAPFVAGAIAALGARHDVRILWMAGAATLVARLGVTVLAKQSTTVAAVVSLTAAFIAACVVAMLFGARGVVGVGMVAVVLAGFATAGAVLGGRSRRDGPTVGPP
jgi:hypothetical protein